MITMPAWKAELLEKRKTEKSKKKDEAVPQWKKDLLKKLHSKAEAAKCRVAEQHRLNENKTILDDHIDKVSDNKFMREEQKLKMTSPNKLSPMKEFPPPLTTPGLHIIKTDQMIIIEKETPDELQEIIEQQQQQQQQHHEDQINDAELPEAGIVSRLKVKFKEDKNVTSNDPIPSKEESHVTPSNPVTSVDGFHRSNSVGENGMGLVINNTDDDVIISPRSPSHPRSKSFPHPSYPLVKPPKPRKPVLHHKQSIEFFTVQSFKSPGANETVGTVTSPTYRKVSAPVSPYKKVQPPVKKETSVDLSTLHAPGQKTKVDEPEKPVIEAKSNTITSVQAKEDITSTLHSGSYNFDKNKPVPKKQENNVTELDSIKLRKTKPRSYYQTDNKKEKSVTQNTPSNESINIVSSKKVEEKPSLKPLPLINKENIPIIPPRRKKATPPSSPRKIVDDLIEPKLIIPTPKIEPPAPKPAPVESKITKTQEAPKIEPNKSIKKDIEASNNSVIPTKIEPKQFQPKNTQIQTKPKKTSLQPEKIKSNGDSQIINLGKISLDPSSLKNKQARALNELMKESKTIQIIPGGNKQRQTPVNFNQIKTTAKKSPEQYNIPKPVKTGAKKPSIAEEEQRILNEIKAMQALLDQAKKNGYVDPPPQKTALKPEKKLTNGVIKPAKTNSVINTKNDLPVSSIDDVIDSQETLIIPTKTVQENHEPSIEENKISVTLNKVENKPNNKSHGFGGFVVNPSKFNKSVAPATTPAIKKSVTINPAAMSNTFVIKPATTQNNNTDKKVTKGKRKPTVDQITVIGGYVKLEHSSLAKKNKTRKVNVDFSSVVKMHTYTSERSLLDEDPNSLIKHPGSGRESQLGKYTPKYLLSMKDKDNSNSNNNSNQYQAEEEEDDEDLEVRDATPLENAEAFSFSSSADLLF